MDNYSDQLSGFLQGRPQTGTNQRRPYSSNEFPARQQLSPTPANPPANQQNQQNMPMPATPIQQAVPGPPTPFRQSIAPGDSPQYLNQFLVTQIGRKVRAEFLIGTGMLIDKTGVLVEVGANYIILNETATDDYIACDYYSLKFVTIYY